MTAPGRVAPGEEWPKSSPDRSATGSDPESSRPVFVLPTKRTSKGTVFQDKQEAGECGEKAGTHGSGSDPSTSSPSVCLSFPACPSGRSEHLRHGVGETLEVHRAGGTAPGPQPALSSPQLLWRIPTEASALRPPGGEGRRGGYRARPPSLSRDTHARQPGGPGGRRRGCSVRPALGYLSALNFLFCFAIS